MPKGWLKSECRLKNKFSYISITDDASDFKFVVLLGFAKAHHKITPRGNVGVALGYGAAQSFEVHF